MIGTKRLRIRFDKVDGFIRVYDRNRFAVLLGFEKYNAIYDRIRYLIGLKYSITLVYPYNFGKIKIDSDDDLPLIKTLTLHNVIILI